MTLSTRLESFWHVLTGRNGREAREVPAVPDIGGRQVAVETAGIAPNDPIVAFCQGSPSILNVDSLTLDSPTLDALKAAGVKLVVPMVSQGELIGLLNLGSRLSGQDYSADDRRLLQDLSTQAAPAVRVAQMVRQQRDEARQRERIEQELRIARVIQQSFLPKEVPAMEGWEVAAHYGPAREVGGDFYDFVSLPDGRIAFVIGDVTDKGVPAALVMATTRGILRSSAQRLVEPSHVLERVNDLLCQDIPPNMFVTCLYAVLDPASGRISYANAGHDLPYVCTSGELTELRATGMPLGLMPNMDYPQFETTLPPGASVLLYSDGLVEAHNSDRDMFGFPRLKTLVSGHPGGAALIEFLLGELRSFTGQGWQQEDDVTLVTLQRSQFAPKARAASTEELTEVLGFSLASERGNERLAIARVEGEAKRLGLPEAKIAKLKTAVAEATMNAMEHGNLYDSDLPVSISMSVSKNAVAVKITDHGGMESVPEAATPDLEAKLADEQTPRGWGLFLIEQMVDRMEVTTDGEYRTVELTLSLGAEDDISTA